MSEEVSIPTMEKVWKLSVSVGLMFFSGLFSGLTLGLLGLDSISLRVIAARGPIKDRGYAKKILPVRKHTNLLLCTLLLGNVVVNSLMSILTAEILGGLMGLIISSAAIVLFGEIIPQATCSRYALQIGARTRPLVQLFMFAFFPIAKPISMILDKVLGKDVGQIFDKDELSKLIEYHAKAEVKSGISGGDTCLMTGAMNFLNTRVGDIMTKMGDVFLLEVDAVLDEDTLALVWRSGHSRVPVYEKDHDNIVGILFTKDLILVSSEDSVTVRNVLRHFRRDVEKVFEDTQLDTLLKYFKSGRGHLAVVQRVCTDRPGDPLYETAGIITLEDCIERLIQDKVYDETDNTPPEEREKEHGSARLSGREDRGLVPFNLISRGTENHLTAEHARAVAGYLACTTDPFKSMGVDRLASLLREAQVNNYVVNPHADGEESSDTEQYVLFHKHQPADAFVMLFSGRVEVKSGADNFKSEIGPWCCLGQQAMEKDDYICDFTATVVKTARIMLIRRHLYLKHASPPQQQNGAKHSVLLDMESKMGTLCDTV
eukprot:TRINITY_DN57721_c0_g1_i1.p1 TRINITY_DN57721_c0_g1~~TRINITY_DN57721_c0_g1_i1.p1  ORF type:complete len:543 (+),score=32.23 TRINITY_DN57721_c0_g1_i1:55-1683(+)